MKVALVTDTHFGARNDNQVFAKFFSRFWKEVFFPYIDEHKIDHIIHLGDIVDRRKYINYVSSNQLHEDLIKPIAERSMKFWCLVGNHDIYFRNKLDINAIDQLYGTSQYEINLIDKPTEINIDGLDILMMPWICGDNWNESWDALKDTKSQVMMGHLELNGFEMHRGAFCDSGFDKEEFKKFDQVFSGHFHHRSSEGNISYLGCPYEMTWSDFEDQKGFHIYDTETRELEFIPNPLQIFYKFNYDDTNMTIEGLDDIDFSVFESTYVKLIVKNKNNPYLFDLFTDRIEAAGVQNLQILEDLLNLDMDNESGIIDEAKSTIEMLEGYVDQIETTVSKKKLKGLFHNLYTEALTLE